MRCSQDTRHHPYLTMLRILWTPAAFVGGLSFQINTEDLKRGAVGARAVCCSLLMGCFSGVAAAAGPCWAFHASHGVLSPFALAAFDKYDASSAEVMMDKHTGRPRGFGFVFFKDEQGLKDAIRDLHNTVRNSLQPTPLLCASAQDHVANPSPARAILLPLPAGAGGPPHLRGACCAPRPDQARHPRSCPGRWPRGQARLLPP